MIIIFHKITDRNSTNNNNNNSDRDNDANVIIMMYRTTPLRARALVWKDPEPGLEDVST